MNLAPLRANKFYFLFQVFFFFPFLRAGIQVGKEPPHMGRKHIQVGKEPPYMGREPTQVEMMPTHIGRGMTAHVGRDGEPKDQTPK